MKRISPVIVFLAYVILALTTSATCSTWQTYNTSSGLPGNRILSFAVKAKEMAVGTDNGIAVYSGDSCLWKPLIMPDEIASCEVRDLGYDRHGNLWAATARGLVNFQEGGVLQYGCDDRLPNNDVQRIQITDDGIYIGCFGGFVARGITPQSGKTSFIPVNYSESSLDESLKIRSVGISGLGMLDGNQGWFSTLGAGLAAIYGSSQSILDSEKGLTSDWIEAFWVFTGPLKSQHLLALSSEKLVLIKNGTLLRQVSFPEPDAWLTSLAMFEEQQVYEMKEKADDEEQIIRDFIGDRTLWIGTRNHGLWRRQNGVWTNYLPENSRLPSSTILRLYPLQYRLVVCTDQGLVIIPLLSSQYDEFAKQGLGNRNFKTIFPMPASKVAMIRFNQIVRGSDMWFSHQQGLSRYISASGIFRGMLHNNPELTGSVDTDWAFTSVLAGEDNMTVGDAPVQRPGERMWQMFSKQYFIDKEEDLPIYSDNITCMTITPDDHLYVIFEKKVFARLRMLKLPRRCKDDDERREKPKWDYFPASIPWGDVKLLSIWFHNDQLFVGTDGDGFYVLTNPSCIEDDPNAYDWRHYGILEGLLETRVTGFTSWNPGGENLTVLMHPREVTVWNGESFDSLRVTSGAALTCLSGDTHGNLWLGTKQGLIRVHDDRKVTTYRGFHAGFESDNITAIAVAAAKTGQSAGVWVANDQLADMVALNSQANGSDQPPNVITTSDGRKILLELDIDGSSLHFYDGLIWDKWKVPGVRSIYLEDDYLWVTTNIRVRRLRVK